MKNIFLIDILAKENMHVEFNKKIIDYALSSHEKVTFIAQKNYIKKNKFDEIESLNAVYLPSYIKNKFILLLFFIFSYFYLWIRFCVLNKGRARFYFLNTDFTVAPFFMYLFRFKSSKVFCVVHNSKSLFRSRIKMYLFKSLCKSTSFFTMTHHTTNLFNKLGLTATFILHPVYNQSSKLINKENNCELLTLGLVSGQGVLAVKSGFLINVCETIDRIGKHVNIEIVGNVRSVIIDVKEIVNKFKFVNYYEHQLDEHSFYRKISSYDAVLIPLSDETKYRPSGIVANCLSVSQYVICPGDDYFKEYKKIFPSLVLLYEDLEDIPKLLTSLRILNSNFSKVNINEKIKLIDNSNANIFFKLE